MNKKLLLNWFYWPPVGHVVEAMKISKGYALANPDLDIYLIINNDAPIELAESCSWIKAVYSISTEDVLKSGRDSKFIQKIPKEWDYIITDDRSREGAEGKNDSDLGKVHRILHNELVVKNTTDYLKQAEGYENGILNYFPNPKVTLEVPAKAKEFVSRFKHNGPIICVMLGGSAGPTQSPSIEMWFKICSALEKEILNLKICFTGVTKSDDGRTTTKGFTCENIQFLVDNLSNAESAYDIGLWNQIALIEDSDIFLSPHTGFAFIAPLVETPWLEIATCPWPAYVFNDLPFYSILPRCGSYPSKGNPNKNCSKLMENGKKALCVTDALLQEKIPEIIAGMKLLLDKSFTYEKAMKLHQDKIKKDYTPEDFFYLGGKNSI